MTNISFSIEFIVFVIFSAAFLILLFYYLFVFRRFAFHKKSSNLFTGEQPVTIVIAAKNEENNLQKNLPYILAQDYSEFEVIVVNDFSTDDTESILEQFQISSLSSL